ncbi:BTAD domain-containing putative transcriptional regulator [Streptomyces sp. NPDC038707]|uniref:AfsR/SARP family transcriptional regulator n=1 Tax=Streptomyces sp. NPDC038707 TaxID=3154329 RepID=UPI0033D66A6E
MEAAGRVGIAILGGLELWLGDRPQPVGHARRRAVLAVLAAEANRVVPVDSVIDRVWGERPPDKVRSALRVYLSHLRRALTPTGMTIARQESGYVLVADAHRVDLHLFRRLLAQSRDAREPRRALSLVGDALTLWRGEPLAELDTPWAQAVRERLRRERAAAEGERIDWALACGRHRQVLPELTTRADAEPLDERLAGQVMLALYRSGRQADALVRYQHTRQRLLGDLGVDPGPALQELHQRILTADPALVPTDGTAATVTARAPAVPRQLPAPPQWFTGRGEHLAALTAAADQRDTMLITAIGGTGGIGKTWLALAWAHRHLDRFPDGQLFVDLHGFSPDTQPMDPATALRGFLGALGVPADRFPHDPDAQAALYRSLVAGKRMLVVLDNAATAEQVVPLLPGTASCTVLVTSRHRLPGLIARHGARPLSLGMFTDAEAHALLVAALGADRVAADEHAVAELMALCGGFPLALGLITARIRYRLRPVDAVAELRTSVLDALDADDPTASLPSVVSWSLRRLTERQRTVFALLGIAPGPDTGLPAAACLTGLPVRETRAVLRGLADACLLDSHHGERYAMHDLVRAFATTYAHHSLTAPVRRAALERGVDFYRHTAHTADGFLNPHRAPIALDPLLTGTHPQPLPDHPAALAWMDTHHPHLLAAQQAAAGHHRHQAVWHLAWTLTAFHRRRGHRHAELAVWRAAVAAAAHLPAAARILAHRRLGSAHAVLGQHEQAMRHLHRALALAEDHHDATQQAHNHHALARAWERRGDSRRSLEHSRHARDLFQDLGQTVWEAVTLNAAGWFAALLGDYDTAREHCGQALALHDRHHDPNGKADVLDSLGYIDCHTGRHRQAVRRYRQALALYRALGNTSQYADTLDRLGHPYTALGDDERARAVWREAQELYRQHGREPDAERVRRHLDDLAG